jgi:hypothetical protein
MVENTWYEFEGYCTGLISKEDGVMGYDFGYYSGV